MLSMRIELLKDKHVDNTKTTFNLYFWVVGLKMGVRDGGKSEHRQFWGYYRI